MNQSDQALARTEASALIYPTQSAVAGTLASIEAFQTLVKKRLKAPRDYAKLPGTERFTLLKPGAEKIVKLITCADTYVVLDEITDWDRPLFAYTVKCRLVSMRDQSVIWSEGLGECNTHEPKYRYRTAQRRCPQCSHEPVLKSKHDPEWFCWQARGGCGATYNLNDPVIADQVLGRIEHPDPAELRNTMLKMAKKRSLVDAALSVASLSDLFTQDMDDAVEDTDTDAPPEEADSGRQRQPTPQRSQNGHAGTNQPRQAAVAKVKDIKNGGDFMVYVNARWPGHSQQDILGCLNVTEISDMTWTPKQVSGYLATLVGFWGQGGEDGDPAANEQPAQEDSGDVSRTNGDGVETEAAAQPGVAADGAS